MGWNCQNAACSCKKLNLLCYLLIIFGTLPFPVPAYCICDANNRNNREKINDKLRDYSPTPTLDKVPRRSGLDYYPCDAMLARVLAMALCLSVCLSQVGVLLKWLEGSSWFLAGRLLSISPSLCGSVLLWRRRDTLCASGFMDDVTFSHMAGIRPRKKRRLLKITQQGAARIWQRGSTGAGGVCSYTCSLVVCSVRGGGSCRGRATKKSLLWLTKAKVSVTVCWVKQPKVASRYLLRCVAFYFRPPPKKKIAGRTSHLLTPGAENPTGWAKTAGPQTDDHSSVKSYPISILFSLEDSLVNLQLKGYKKIPPHLAYVWYVATLPCDRDSKTSH